MKIFVTELDIVPSQGGNITPDLIPSMIRRAENIASSEYSYFTNQFYNVDSVKWYEQIGQELVEQIEGSFTAFFGGVGTAGMLMGVAHNLRRHNPAIRIVALEPAFTPMISKDIIGTHHIEGVGVGFVPPLLDKNFFNEARGIDESEARLMARRLAREEGIFAGTSTGMNVVGAIGWHGNSEQP